jgi:hypothetical protein
VVKLQKKMPKALQQFSPLLQQVPLPPQQNWPLGQHVFPQAWLLGQHEPLTQDCPLGQHVKLGLEPQTWLNGQHVPEVAGPMQVELLSQHVWKEAVPHPCGWTWPGGAGQAQVPARHPPPVQQIWAPLMGLVQTTELLGQHWPPTSWQHEPLTQDCPLGQQATPQL